MDVAIGNIMNSPWVQHVRNLAAEPQTTPKEVAPGGTQAFDTLFKAALELVNETSQLQFDAEVAQLNFVTGRDDNVLTVLMAQDRAYSALNFTVQVTNKIIEAYREIMRMQV